MTAKLAAVPSFSIILVFGLESFNFNQFKYLIFAFTTEMMTLSDNWNFDWIALKPEVTTEQNCKECDKISWFDENYETI